MTKRVLLPLVLLGLLLSGCGGAKDARPPYQPSDARALIDAGAFTGEMEEVDSYVAAMLYKLGEDDMEGCACYMAVNTSVSADEIVVLVLKDEEAAARAAAGCEARRADLAEQCRDYCPDQMPKLEAAQVRTRGATVLFAVGDRETLEPALEELGLG